MSDPVITPIELAASERFERSTPEELNAFIAELGLDTPLRSTSDQKRRALLNALGIEANIGNNTHSHKPVAVARAGEDIFPPYNLTAEGVWGGRRRRIKLPRPEGVKLENAAPFSWNGKAPYYIAYDEVQNIPEPIFNILVTNKRRRPIQKRTPMADNPGVVEIETAWEFDDISFTDLGVDPATKDRAGSLMEWYQSKGPNWFDGRSHRELQLIAARCEVSMRTLDGKSLISETEARGVLKTFFFGYPDAVDAKPEKVA